MDVGVEEVYDDPTDTSDYPEELLPYVETDQLRAQELPSVLDIDTTGRDIQARTATGEDLSEAEYLAMLKQDLSDNQEFLTKMQWMGERELVHGLAEQTKWLVGRMLAGENVLVMDEAFNRTIKSGAYVTELITSSAQTVTEKLKTPPTGRLLGRDDLDTVSDEDVDRVVVFDDWVGSGGDMTIRTNWTEDLIENRGIDRHKFEIHLLAAHESFLTDGFRGYKGGQLGRPVRVVAPYTIHEYEGVMYPPFSGIHSDMDYSFTMLEAMNEAVESRSTDEYKLVSPYHISSMDTLGSDEFYARIKSGVEQTVDIA